MGREKNFGKKYLMKKNIDTIINKERKKEK